MKFSFHTCGLEWLPFEEVVNQLADLGYAACGPIVGPDCHLDPDTLNNSQKESYKNLVEARNMEFSILNPWKVGGFAAGVESGATRDFYHKALDLAAEIGASGVKFLPGGFASGEAAGWKAMVQILRPLCYHAEQVGVDLLMHNHENHLIDTANGFALLRRHLGSEQLQINLDCANLAILMDDPCHAIRNFKDNLRHIRVKGMSNYYPFAQQCVPGSPGDIVDWRTVFEALVEIDYTGFVELVTYDWFPPDYSRFSIEWATALADEVGA